MKNKILFLSLCFCLVSCDKPGDCIKSAGATATREFDSLEFDKVLVKRGISVVITQGDSCSVTVQSGENLVDDIKVSVTDRMLTLEDGTTCNWVRDYGQTVVYITAPNLSAIYSKTELDINSHGVLTYPNLQIFAMDSYDGFAGTGTGDYHLQVDNAQLSVGCNTVARIFLTGQTNQADFSIYEYGGKIMAQELVAQTVQFYHRGTNDMHVHAVQALKGNLYNIGNLYSVTHPPVVEVTQHYNGHLLFY